MSRDNPYEGSKYSYVDRVFIIDDRAYRWCGWFGCQLQSIEWRRPAPQYRRRILGREFKPYRVVRRWLVWEVSWALTGDGEGYDAYGARVSDLHRDLVGGRA